MTVVPLRKVEPIGGSEAAAAAGIDPHKSRLALWLEKHVEGGPSGLPKVPREETEAMRWGTAIEPLIFEALARDHTVERWPPDGVSDPERPWLVGHPDGFVAEGPPGSVRLSLLEAKTAGHWSGREWRDGVPIAYIAQVQHYLHLTGLERALLACLVGGQRLVTVWLDRDQHAIDLLLQAEEEFHGFLVRDEPPPPRHDDREQAAAMFPEATAGRRVRLDKASWSVLRELHARREQRQAIERQEEVLTNMLKLVMEDAELAISPHDEDVISWRNVESQRVDVTALREAHPEIAAEFVKTTTTRRFALL